MHTTSAYLTHELNFLEIFSCFLNCKILSIKYDDLKDIKKKIDGVSSQHIRKWVWRYIDQWKHHRKTYVGFQRKVIYHSLLISSKTNKASELICFVHHSCLCSGFVLVWVYLAVILYSHNFTCHVHNFIPLFLFLFFLFVLFFCCFLLIFSDVRKHKLKKNSEWI